MQVIDSYEGCCRQMAKTRCLVSNSGEQAAEGQTANQSGQSKTPSVPCCWFGAR
jgi:hypothetical protein